MSEHDISRNCRRRGFAVTIIGMTDLANRCSTWTGRVQILAGVQLATLMGTGLIAASKALAVDWIPAWSITLALIIIWMAWVCLQFSNYRLMACGEQSVRYAHAPRLINRPDLFIRILNHLLVNWSAVAATLTAIWIVDDFPGARAFAWFSAIMTILTLVLFNMLHRRINRMQNILLSSTIAIVLLAASVLIFLQG
jgi:hypothetical protein